MLERDETMHARIKSERTWWIVAGIIVAAIILLLILIVARQAPEAEKEIAPGETETLRARVVQVLEEGTISQDELQQPYQRLKLLILEGTHEGEEVEVEQGVTDLTTTHRLFRPGDQLLVERTRAIDGADLYMIVDLIRSRSLWWLTFLFIAATILINGRQGIRSLVAMAISLVAIVGFIVPQILAGHNPIVVALAGSVVTMGISLYLVYGWNRKSHAAVVGLFLSLVLTGLLAGWFVNWTRLSGIGSEDAWLLQAAGLEIDPRGLLLAGIIIGALGALDDVTVGQSSAILELHKANPQLGWRALFKHGMNIGRDHIAAMINTLLLAYVGAALPLLLLFSVYTEPLAFTLSREIIAEEIVRTLAGSFGLLSAVPLTSLVAAVLTQHPVRDREAVGGEPSLEQQTDN